MADDLSELHERIEWCRAKAGALETQIAAAGNASVEHWIENWPGVGFVKGRLVTPPTVALRAEIGVIVNEQRAILDGLACALATRNGANHTNDVYFPITRDRTGFDELGRRKIRKLAQADRDKIEALKPWSPMAASDEGHPDLFPLHEADRVRKHQKLLKWACLGGVGAVGPGRIGMLECRPVVFDMVGGVAQLAMFRDITCQLGVSIELIYIEPDAIAGRRVVGCLHSFNDAVDAIVASFA